MTTVTKGIADEVIANDGYYPGDPRVTKVVQYQNQWGGTSYALVYHFEDQMRYENSSACFNVKVIWRAT